MSCELNHDDELLEASNGNILLRFNIAIGPQNYNSIPVFSYYVDRYRNPWQVRNPLIAFNPWNVKIFMLRRIRLEIMVFLREIIDYTLGSHFREFIDSSEAQDDSRHYFYHHCPFFRLLDPTTPLIFQGFSRKCIHQDYDRPEALIERLPSPPRNPLLTADEDEFLYHISTYYLSLGHAKFSNSIRHLREVTYFLSSHARTLFNEGYLDPDYMFDGQGNRRAISWRDDQLEDL